VGSGRALPVKAVVCAFNFEAHEGSNAKGATSMTDEKGASDEAPLSGIQAQSAFAISIGRFAFDHADAFRFFVAVHLAR
jgi:hypothetical protein